MESKNPVVANALAANAAVKHNDIESQYIAEATRLVFDGLGKVSTALVKHWDSKGEQYCRKADEQGFKGSRDKIKAAYERITRNLNAAMQAFNERASHV